MAVIVETSKIAVNVKVITGTTEYGQIKTATMKLGSINKDTFDASKAYAISALLAPCLEKEIHSLEKVETSTINEDE